MKPLAPTLRRLRRARELGESPRFAILIGAVGLLAGATVLAAAATATARRTADLLRAAIVDPRSADARLLGREVLALSLPPLLVVAAASIAASLVLSRGWMVWRVPGRRSATVLRALGGALAAALIGTLTLRVMLVHGPDLAGAVGSVPHGTRLALDLVRHLIWLGAAVLLALGLGDALWEHWRFHRRLRMTPGELRRERRQTEGDPAIKSAWRRARADERVR